jgi:hypothetical protein
MNVSITLPDNVEAELARRAAAAGMDVATFVRDVVVDSLAEGAESETLDSHVDFMAKLDRIIQLHPRSTGPVDDSRESIYAGRGE